MKKRLACCVIVGLFMSVGTAGAAPITNAFGLTSPDTTITFGEVALADGTVLTNQFSALGVTFSGLFYDTQIIGASGLTAPIAENFPNAGCVVCSPFDIFFTVDVSAAAFQMITNPGTSTFQAFLNGLLVETFAAATTVPSSTYYGFQSITFDQIRVIPGGVNAAGGIDNIEFDAAPAPVPEPASLLLLGTGLLAIGVRRWRQRRA